MTKAQGRAFRARWRAINDAERRELRKTPIEVKFHQLAALMASARELGWKEGTAAEEAEMRGRWKRLRKAYSV